MQDDLFPCCLAALVRLRHHAHAMRLPFFYGWIIVAVTFITMAIGVNARTAFSAVLATLDAKPNIQQQGPRPPLGGPKPTGPNGGSGTYRRVPAFVCTSAVESENPINRPAAEKNDANGTFRKKLRLAALTDWELSVTLW